MGYEGKRQPFLLITKLVKKKQDQGYDSDQQDRALAMTPTRTLYSTSDHPFPPASLRCPTTGPPCHRANRTGRRSEDRKVVLPPEPRALQQPFAFPP